MRDLAYHLAAGAVAERRAAEIRKQLRTRPHTPAERDDAEQLATIYEAAAFDLLARGPRPTPPSTVAPAKRATKVDRLPIRAWQAELDRIRSGESGLGGQRRASSLENALARATERADLMAKLWRLDQYLSSIASIGCEDDEDEEVVAPRKAPTPPPLSLNPHRERGSSARNSKLAAERDELIEQIRFDNQKLAALDEALAGTTEAAA